MALNQKNSYTPGQNLTNLALNVDYNRLGRDLTNITVNFGTSPATVSVKQGSIIETNGNEWHVESADFSFQMTNTTDNYIVFDPSTPEFKSASSKGTYNNSKAGIYQTGNTIRTCRWYIDQTEETYNIDDSIMSYNIGDLKTEINSYIYDGSTTGFSVYSRAGSGSGTLFSDTWTIYKPCQFVFQYGLGPYTNYNNGSNLFNAVRESYLQMEFNGGWNAYHSFTNQAFLASGGGTTIRDTFHLALNPGKYRLAFDSSQDIDIYLMSVYGQTNFDASSVIVIV